MDLLLQLVRWEIQIFLVGLAVVVFYQLLTGRINTRYLLHGRISGANGNGDKNGNNKANNNVNPDNNTATNNSNGKDSDLYFSPDRVQLLFFTLGAAMYYLMQTINTAKLGKLPDIPDTLPAVLGGSNAIYLGGKAYARWFANSDSK